VWVWMWVRVYACIGVSLCMGLGVGSGMQQCNVIAISCIAQVFLMTMHDFTLACRVAGVASLGGMDAELSLLHLASLAGKDVYSLQVMSGR
jgi:hypothetical protein